MVLCAAVVGVRSAEAELWPSIDVMMAGTSWMPMGTDQLALVGWTAVALVATAAVAAALRRSRRTFLVVLALSGIVPESCVELMRLVREGKLDEGRRLQQTLMPLARAIGAQHGVPAQSSLPSQVAAKPLQLALSAMQLGPLTKSAQHFCMAVQLVAPHRTGVAGGDASGIMLLPLPLPLPLPPQMPLTHG